MIRSFDELSEQEILALAISVEEEHARIYESYAHGLAQTYPASAQVFTEMAAEEHVHRGWLIDLHRKRFGDVIPLIRPQDVRGFMRHEPIWLVRPLGLEKVREQASTIEETAHRFYTVAVGQAKDAATRQLLGDLAAAEGKHVVKAKQLQETVLTPDVRTAEDAEGHRQFVLTYVQPGLAGLMDGSVSTLAPIFAAAFATGNTWQTFLVGLAASIGAGISMGMTEALSDDGKISGRGSPITRGVVTGVMTTAGGLGHALPYLIPNFNVATGIAFAVVFVELWIIAWIRAKYMETPFLRAVFEVVVGGTIVFAVGILIGNS
ncbi:MAG: ferritin family protein [Hyphomicrobium aestuarii]|nr:ferritin family protein [Hyphomicrobium aestuarii]